MWGLSRLAEKTERTRVRVYRSLEELPEVLEPGKYLVEGREVVLYEPVDRETLVRDIRKIEKYIRLYGSDGWV